MLRCIQFRYSCCDFRLVSQQATRTICLAPFLHRPPVLATPTQPSIYLNFIGIIQALVRQWLGSGRWPWRETAPARKIKARSFFFFLSPMRSHNVVQVYLMKRLVDLEMGWVAVSTFWAAKFRMKKFDSSDAGVVIDTKGAKEERIYSERAANWSRLSSAIGSCGFQLRWLCHIGDDGSCSFSSWVWRAVKSKELFKRFCMMRSGFFGGFFSC